MLSRATGITNVIRRLVAALSVAFVMLAQLTPAFAATGGDGDWMEICSEFGVVLKKVTMDDDDSGTTPSCPDCETCLFCYSIETTDPYILRSFDLVHLNDREPSLGAMQIVAPNPAQFWPDNRGPPLAKESDGPLPLGRFKVQTHGIGGAS